MTTLPLHVPVEGYAVQDGCLWVGGRSLVDLAREVGSTPFYAYDRALIGARIRTLRETLPRGVELHYAMKANPMPAVVDFVANLVDGLDVASGGELDIALRSGMRASEISFAGPGKSVPELRKAVAAGIVLNVESATELGRIAEIAERSGGRPRVAIRVNPSFELKSSGMKMSGGPKQFGIDAESVPEMLRGLGKLPVDFVGFHIFSGSQNLRAEAVCEAQTKTLALALDLAGHAPNPPHFINMGGGFGIPYFPGEKALDLAAVGRNLTVLAAELRTKLPRTKMIIELGRYLVGESGIYVCEIVDRKVSRGHTFLVTNGGLHHHLAASGNFGQVLRKNYPVLIGNNVNGERSLHCSVVGPLCTPLDLLADRVDLADAKVGDLVVVFQSGAYGLTASPTAFLGHPRPAEILV
jgi:diaminopimelate decarboxylase